MKFPVQSKPAETRCIFKKEVVNDPNALYSLTVKLVVLAVCGLISDVFVCFRQRSQIF